jgi:hypothetical protein
MKNISHILLLLLLCYNTHGQKQSTINQYLNGIWKIEESDINSYEIFINNKLFYLEEPKQKNITVTFYYCFPKVSSYTENAKTGKKQFKVLSKESIDKDRFFQVIDDSEIIEIIYYSKNDTLQNGSINHSGPDFFQINPTNHNSFIAWNYTNSQNIITYKRVISPPKFVVDFLKKITLFRIVKSPKSIVYSLSETPTRMYLIKGDEVEILEEKDEWLRVRFYGKKIIEGWIKKSDVE